MNNKRKRSSNNDTLDNLPDAVLSHVSSYLAMPSMALFAMSLMTSRGTPNTKSSAIIAATPSWQALDFSDIEKSLAARLTDDHMHAILRCFDAPNNLKRLNLAGCVNITGSGLDILRNSALECVDLSLVEKHASPVIDPNPKLLEAFVIPVLDAIMERGCLKLIILPKKFRDSTTEGMSLFLDRYKRYLSAFRITCSNCSTLCGETGNANWVGRNDNIYWGLQNYTCNECMGFYCYNVECTDNLHWCEECEKEYCHNCVQSKRCICERSNCNACKVMNVCEGGCGQAFCESCSDAYECSCCNRAQCGECVPVIQCRNIGCFKGICEDCIENEGEGGRCSTCNKTYCSAECQYLKCEKDQDEDEVTACSACAVAAAKIFRRKFHESQQEVEALGRGRGNF